MRRLGKFNLRLTADSLSAPWAGAAAKALVPAFIEAAVLIVVILHPPKDPPCRHLTGRDHNIDLVNFHG